MHGLAIVHLALQEQHLQEQVRGACRRTSARQPEEQPQLQLVLTSKIQEMPLVTRLGLLPACTLHTADLCMLVMSTAANHSLGGASLKHRHQVRSTYCSALALPYAKNTCCLVLVATL